MKTIVVDPGHGGTDPGAVNGTRYEKDDNLRLGLAVRDRLLAQGQKVIMTRTTDVNVPLLERSAISNRNGADLFISLHRNAVANNTTANGVENFVQPNSPPINTRYARTVLDQVVAAGVQSDRGIQQGNFSVLRNTVAPAQLLEMGFITNAADNELFDTHLNAYADAIARGILLALGEPIQGPTPPTAPPPAVSDDPLMRSIQTTLNERYNAGLVVDGIFGPATKRAMIRGFQTELNQTFGANLVVDGVFGPATRAATPVLRLSTSGPLAYLLQAALYAAGYLKIDSTYGPQTEQVVRAYQGANGLQTDGMAGPDTFVRLFG